MRPFFALSAVFLAAGFLGGLTTVRASDDRPADPTAAAVPPATSAGETSVSIAG